MLFKFIYYLFIGCKGCCKIIKNKIVKHITDNLYEKYTKKQT